jgi:type VI secretion system protein ImpE
LEIIIGGRFGLLAFESVHGITSEGPKDLRDLVWLPVELALRSGQSVAGFIPARYAGTEHSQDNRIRLAKRTDWTDRALGPEGAGQRQWFFGNDVDVGILELKKLQFL